jgi:hypothetical protein
MRNALLVALLVLLLLVPRTFKASALEQNPDGAAPQDHPAEQKMEPVIESEDDIFSTTYERELLSRRFFQKTLPPLNRREKIIWAFKTARANVLL